MKRFNTDERPTAMNQRSPSTTGNVRIQASKSQCEEAGCSEHCACKPNDPLIYAAVGFLAGGVIIGAVAWKMKR